MVSVPVASPRRAAGAYHAAPMPADPTTLVVQRYLDAIAGDDRAETLVRALLDRAVERLHLLCSNLLQRSYPRLSRPPLNLRPEELLSAVVERLLKALRAVRPGNVRQFFALANQHMRWELNDLARRLDQQPPPQPLAESGVAAPESSASGLSPNARRMLSAIDALPEDERETFSLVRIQGLTHGEAADVLAVSTKTVQRRLNRSLLLLASALADLGPPPASAP
jgi:RNA polymerase sigma-70 factor (ECF subfamily)